ncbi:hypothetical protein ACOKM5_06040 [Streptomyces sp. BH097]|uniref:hypothetical protein n=1 Tax=unclassified Streptomyces TaxID=2593676 RepID=UPI003BB6EB97
MPAAALAMVFKLVERDRAGIVRQAAGMKSRPDGMWWGTTIEAPDPSGLAKFYAELLGWHIGHEEPGTATVATSPTQRSQRP